MMDVAIAVTVGLARRLGDCTVVGHGVGEGVVTGLGEESKVKGRCSRKSEERSAE